jgi:hypothetical protein
MHTMTTKPQIENIADTNVNDTQKSLVPSLEFTLIEDLHRDDGRIFDRANVRPLAKSCTKRWAGYEHIKAFVPIGI